MADVSSMAFGGAWSGKKLDVLREYLTQYTTALRNQPFKLVYIDAFAGAGVREVMPRESGELFDDVLARDDAEYRHGSPLISLNTKPSFDKFIFIEKDASSMGKLRDQVIDNFPEKLDRVIYKNGDANKILSDIAGKDWSGKRAVAFLDPFALQVSWDTIVKLAETKCIDMWLLFPAMAVNRMLARNGRMPKQWVEKLTLAFGDSDWQKAFYVEEDADLFGDARLTKVPRVFDALGSYITGKLKSVFAGVIDSPLLLCNSKKAPLFLLCFGSGNPKGAEIAKRIATHIINKRSNGQ